MSISASKYHSPAEALPDAVHSTNKQTDPGNRHYC